MRRIREALRLHLQAGLSYNEVGRALKISKSVVGKYVSLAKVAGVDCTVADGLDDAELESRLYRPAVPRASHQLAPDFGQIHQELKRPGVTLMLLWEEYATGNALAGASCLFSGSNWLICTFLLPAMWPLSKSAIGRRSTTSALSRLISAVSWAGPSRR